MGIVITQQGWLPESRNDVLAKFVLFIFSPFLSFCYSLLRIKTKSSFIVFFLASIFYGMSTVYDSNAPFYIDGMSHMEDFLSYKYVTYSEFIDRIKLYFSFDNEYIKDLYDHTVKFIVSRFTNNYHVFFMVIAVVFSFFSLKTFKMFVKEKEFDNSYYCYILAYIFMSAQIFHINGVRFYTAYWIALFALFKIFKEKKNVYILLALVTPLVHSAYIVYCLLLLIILLFRRFDKFWAIAFVVSIFVSEVSLKLFRDNISYMPLFVQNWGDSYLRQEAVDKMNQAGTGFWMVGEIFGFIRRMYINILVFIFVLNYNGSIKYNARVRVLYQILLVFAAFSNFTMSIPSLGQRYTLFVYPLIAYMWMILFKGKKYRNILAVMPIIYLMSFYGQARLYSYVLEPTFFYSSPFYLIYKYIFLG